MRTFWWQLLVVILLAALTWQEYSGVQAANRTTCRQDERGEYDEALQEVLDFAFIQRSTELPRPLLNKWRQEARDLIQLERLCP